MNQNYAFENGMDMDLTYEQVNVGKINYIKNFNNIHLCPLPSCGIKCEMGQVPKHLECHAIDSPDTLLKDFEWKKEQYRRISMDIFMIGCLLEFKKKKGHLTKQKYQEELAEKKKEIVDISSFLTNKFK